MVHIYIQGISQDKAYVIQNPLKATAECQDVKR